MIAETRVRAARNLLASLAEAPCACAQGARDCTLECTLGRQLMRCQADMLNWVLGAENSFQKCVDDLMERHGEPR